MASASKNIDIQEPLLSESETRLADLSKSFDGYVPFEFNSTRVLFISPMEATGYQSSDTSLNTPSMTSSITSFYHPRETLGNYLSYSPAKFAKDSLLSAVSPCSLKSDGFTLSPRLNVPRDNSNSLFVHDKTRESSPSRSSAIVNYSHRATEASNSARLSPDTHPEPPWFSILLREANSLVGAGLANLGNTCFMNSILQCMTHTTLLVHGLRTADHLKICQCGNKHFCLFCALHDHIELSLSSSGGIVSPHKLADNINYISSDFERLKQEDAHEFLQCLLDKLREPCSFLMENNGLLAWESDNLVQRTFGGRLLSKVHCYNCGHISDKTEPLMDLSLEIENVDSLLGALESFTQVEKLDDDPESRFTCENCREVGFIEKQLILDEVPSVAIFHLKRFKIDGMSVEKIKKSVKFPLELDMKPYTLSARDSNVDLHYELYGIVEHVGDGSSSGHYISFVRPSRDSWFRFNDSKVTLVPQNYVLSQEAYILFYAKKGTPWASTLMEGQKASLASVAEPMAVPDNSCHREPMIDNGSVDESTELCCVVPCRSSGHPLSAQPSGAVEEFGNSSIQDASKSGHGENEEHGNGDDSGGIDCFHTITPAGSPETDAAIIEPQGPSAHRAGVKPGKRANAERQRKKVVDGSERREAAKPLKKVVDSSEKREALRYVQRSMSSARGMRFITAMLESRGERSPGKAKRARASPCKKSGSPNTRRKLAQSSVARFVAAGN